MTAPNAALTLPDYGASSVNLGGNSVTLAEASIVARAASALVRANGAPPASLSRSDVAYRGGSEYAACVHGTGSLASRGSGVRVPPFLTKLYTIMQEASPHDYAGWCPDGMSFRISDPQKFADHCLPRFFKHNKLGSFQQQLLTYGFTRVPNESCLDISSIWQHPQFQAGRPEQLEKINRATAKKATTDAKLDSRGGGADKGEGEGEGGDGDEEAPSLAQMQSRLQNLNSALHSMREEMRTTRALEMQVLEQLIERVNKLPKKPKDEGATKTQGVGALTGGAETASDRPASASAVEKAAASATPATTAASQ